MGQSRSVLSRAGAAAVYYAVALLLAGLACNLSDTPSKTPTAGPTPSAGLIPGLSPTPPAPPINMTATPAPTQTLSSSQVPPTPFNCNPRRDWPIYLVQPGDTISDLAVRTFTTVEILAAANCLLDPSLIYPGQMLFLPFLPPTLTPVPTTPPTPTTDPTRPVFTGELAVVPIWRDAAGWAVTYYNPVQLGTGPVLRAQRVNFFVRLPGGSVQYIDQDSLPDDGASVPYRFPGPGVYTFQAVAVNAVRETESPVFTVRYDPTFTPPEGRYNALIVTPNQGLVNGWYTLASNTLLTITWPGAPVDALRVDFALIPVSADTTPRHLGTDPVPADGAAITWVVPPGTIGYLQAFAAMPDQSTTASEIMNVMAQ